MVLVVHHLPDGTTRYEQVREPTLHELMAVSPLHQRWTQEMDRRERERANRGTAA
jgi:hypothetical protein